MKTDDLNVAFARVRNHLRCIGERDLATMLVPFPNQDTNDIVEVDDPTNLGEQQSSESEGEQWEGYCEFCGGDSVTCIVCGRPAVVDEGGGIP